MAPYWAAETHYKSTGAPHNKAGFWTRSQRLTVAKPPRGLGAPPRQFARGRPTKPRMGDYVVRNRRGTSTRRPINREAGRGGAAATTWIFRGVGLVETGRIPHRGVAATRLVEAAASPRPAS